MSGLRSWTGREFHKRGPAAAKVLSPLLLSVVIIIIIYLISKSYPKFKIDRDIADNADKNRTKTAKSAQGTCNTLFTRHIY